VLETFFRIQTGWRQY